MSRNGILLTSGGLDSTTMAFWLLNQGIDFVPLFINYGQHCAKTEFETLKMVLPSSHINRIEYVDVSSIYSKSSSRFIKPANLWKEDIVADDLYIPYRNVLLLTIGATFAQTLGLTNVYSAFINSNHAKEIDCSNDFFNKMEEMLTDYGSVKINMPFRYFSKYEVAKIGLELEVAIGTTFSCQASPIIPCGACPNCVDRLNAIRKIEQE
ncbi:7-cyano-7-deazaguanine synthase [Pedobacter gandavensis]|uniref:7-cyano-7-deazaguanine synthase n=1 Tax=Pedobacter gandavensis TaxID=2679963 RepID=UPI00293082ED|nr:7-cyano-7-deazaguanine synthase [Pedobacter gandavensis]